MIRSIRIHQFGGPEVLKIENVVIPEPSKGEVRLRIRAIGLNRAEVTFRSGQSPLKPSLPTQLGLEASGEVESVGPGVSDFSPGDRVSVIPSYGVTDYGLYGEVSLAPARALAKIPEGIGWERAAATWTAFGTAWVGLIDIAHLSAGQWVLINAASSSVGLAAMQIARSVGANPIAVTRSSKKAQALHAAGAVLTIASQEEDVAAAVLKVTLNKGVNVIFDAVAGAAFGQLVNVAAPGATVVVYGAQSQEATPLPVSALLVRALTIRGFSINLVTRDDAKLEAMRRFVSEGLRQDVFKPTIAKTFQFDEIVEAHRYIEAGDQIGKIVVTV